MDYLLVATAVLAAQVDDNEACEEIDRIYHELSHEDLIEVCEALAGFARAAWVQIADTSDVSYDTLISRLAANIVIADASSS